MKEMLCEECMSKEAIEDLDNIGDLKALCPTECMQSFKKMDVVGEKVIDKVLTILIGGPMPNDWNDIFSVLIPKVSSPESMKDLRPISLCNVVYELISEVLENRLKHILLEIISPFKVHLFPVG
jgi:hypothetical protein